jgi:hypothetical protein
MGMTEYQAKKLNRWKITARRPRAAFTLTEVAIVLTIVSAILGTIWGVASTVWQNYEVSSTLQQVIKSVGNIRDNNMGIQSWPQANDTDITQTLDSANLLPIEMRRVQTSPGGTALDHAVGPNGGGASSPTWGSFHVLAEARNFRVQLETLTQVACLKLLMQLPLNDASIGIVQLKVIGTVTNTCVITNGVAQGGSCTGVTPMLISTAKAWCNAVGTGNEIDLDFKLHN